MELYKLYTAFKKFELDKNKSITLKKGTDFGIYSNQNNEKFVNFGYCWFRDDGEGKECLNPDDLRYIFSGASLQDEDKLSLGLIRLLNQDGKIYICNKKASSGELADIIGYNHIENEEKLIIHLLHMKREPFIKGNSQTDGYGYYTTAIGQMLQKIEPILGGEISRFFSTDRDIPVKEEEFKEKIEELKSEIKKLEEKTHKQEQEEKIDELKLKIDKLKLKIKELELKIEKLELKEEKEVLEKKKKELELEEEIKKLEEKTHKQEQKEKIKELEQKIENLEQKIEKTESNYQFLSQIMESLEEDKKFLEKMDSSEKGQYKYIKKIDLRVGIAVVNEQLENKINNSTFFMISEILLKGFENTIKPFLEKEITVSFFPIVIYDKSNKTNKKQN